MKEVFHRKIMKFIPLEPYRAEIIWLDGAVSKADFIDFVKRYDAFRPMALFPPLFNSGKVEGLGLILKWDDDMKLTSHVIHTLAEKQNGAG